MYNTLQHNCTTSSLPARTSGISLPVVMCLLVLISIMIGAFFFFSTTSIRMARRWRDADQALFCAVSAIEDVKIRIENGFRPHFESMGQDWGAFSWFESLPYPGVTLPQNAPYHGGTVSVSITGAIVSNRWSSVRYAEVSLVATSTFRNITRTVSEVIQYGMDKPKIFDYSYFLNNFGWFWGSGVTSHGDVRANGNMSLNNRATVNGDAYAAPNPEIGAVGKVQVSGWWKQDTRAQYEANAPATARPLNPPDVAESIDWPMGYDTNTQDHSYHEMLEMPYLGDLANYETLASNVNGRIIQNGTTMVEHVYNGAGPDGVTGTPDDGLLILDGTVNPITIDGPVVVRGDVIIKGEYNGQGCIYAGRNVHIIGNVQNTDLATWSKPDDDPEQTQTLNENKDMIGLAAKGNIIFGDYTQSYWNGSKTYFKPGFTHGYATDASDYAIGYDSDGNTNNGYWFDGNYTSYDGGDRFQDDGTVDSNRRYYESSLSHADFHALCGPNTGDGDPNIIDAVMYNNHAIGGYVGNNSDGFTMNGAMIARDDAIIYRKRVVMNWDIRLGSESFEGIDTYFLPQVLGKPNTVAWRDLP